MQGLFQQPGIEDRIELSNSTRLFRGCRVMKELKFTITGTMFVPDNAEYECNSK